MPEAPVRLIRRGLADMSAARRLRQLHDAVRQIEKQRVLVGIPAEKSSRKKDATINNAELLYIHEHGSPLKNIPARPVLGPAIVASADETTKEMAEAARALFDIYDPDPEKAKTHMRRAGQLVVNAAKRRFGSDDLAPNAPSTIRRKGSNRPLIDTGQLRRAITYVIEELP